MKKTWIIIAAIATALTFGCGKEEHADAHGDEHGHAEEAKAPAHADENVVEIAETMLRDLKLTTTTVEECSCPEAVNVVGEIAADQARYAEAGVPVSARIVRLLAAPGQQVRAGQALAEALSPELGRARADYDAALARLNAARAAAERKRGLADRIVPRREVEEAEAALATAEADLRAAAATLQALGVSPGSRGDSRVAITSPIAGVVIERAINIGQMVDPSHVAFRVGDLSTVWLIAHAYERDAVRIAPGSPARVALTAYPGDTFDGRVALVGHQVDAASRTIPVRVELPNADGRLRPGMSGTASLQIAASGVAAVSVPSTALQRVEDDWVVFIPKGPRTFEIRKVGRGRDLQNQTEILSGLKPGDTIVVNGSFLLKSEAEKGEGGDHHDH